MRNGGLKSRAFKFGLTLCICGCSLFAQRGHVSALDFDLGSAAKSQAKPENKVESAPASGTKVEKPAVKENTQQVSAPQEKPAAPAASDAGSKVQGEQEVVDEGADGEGSGDEGLDGEGSGDEVLDDEVLDDEGSGDEVLDDEGLDDEVLDDEGLDGEVEPKPAAKKAPVVKKKPVEKPVAKKTPAKAAKKETSKDLSADSKVERAAVAPEYRSTYDKKCFLEDSRKIYKDAKLGETSQLDPMVFAINNVDRGNVKDPRGPVVRIGRVYFSPTYLEKKYSIDKTENYRDIIFEIEDSSGNKYTCYDDRFVDGPFGKGDFVVLTVYDGFGSADGSKNEKIKVSPAFKLKGGKEYVVRIWKKEKKATPDPKAGVKNELPEKGDLMIEVSVDAVVRGDALAPSGMDGNLPYSILQSFAHPSQFYEDFYQRKYTILTKNRLDRLMYTS